MAQTDYAYAIARIRSREMSLLTSQDFDLLINAATPEDALTILAGKGYSTGNGDMLEREMEQAYSFITESVDNKDEFSSLIIDNDYQNLKAAIKARFASVPAEGYMVAPSLVDSSLVIKAVNENSFELLPEFLSVPGEEAYRKLANGFTGQAAEAVIDYFAENEKADRAAKSESEILIYKAKIENAVCDIKTAKRCAMTSKNREEALQWLGGRGGIDKEKLLDTAYGGGSLKEILIESGLEEISEEGDGNFTALENKRDELFLNKAKGTKFDIYGANAVAAYYILKEFETRNIRVILSAKKAGISNDEIREKVRA